MLRRTFLTAAGAALLAPPAWADTSIVLLLHGGEAGMEAQARQIKEGLDAGSRMILRVTATSPLRDTLGDKNVVLVYTLGEIALRLVVAEGGRSPLVHLGVDDVSFAAAREQRWAMFPWPDPTETLLALTRLHPRLRRLRLPRVPGDTRVWWEALRLAALAQPLELEVVPCADPREFGPVFTGAEAVWIPPDPRLTTPDALSAASAAARTGRVLLIGGNRAQAELGVVGVAVETDVAAVSARAVALGTAIIAAEPVRRVQFATPTLTVNRRALWRAGVFSPAPKAAPAAP